MNYQEIELKRIAVAQMMSVPGEFERNAQFIAGKSHQDYIHDRLTYQMRAWLTVQPLRKYTFEKPASLWDHIKIVCLPHTPVCFAWMFTPGEMIVEVIEAGVIYPDVVLPNQRSIAYVRDLPEYSTYDGHHS